ncbi:MAG: hypothetical protein RSC04_05435, partial [Bacteroidales bacterium]
MKNFTRLLLCVLFCYSTHSVIGQTSDNISVQGEQGKFVSLNSVAGSRAYHISPNGKYITGVFAPGWGYVYNTETDSVEIYKGIASPLRTNNNKFTVGNVYPNPELDFQMAAYYNAKTKVWDTLVRLSTNSGNLEDFENATACWGVAGNTDKIAGMGYKPAIGKRQIYVGLIWEQGIVTDTLLPFKLYGNNPDDLIGYGARPNGISEDGSTVFGFASNIITKEQRTPHIWRNGKTYYVGDAVNGWDGGECSASNSDGSIVVGSSRENGTLWHWDGSQYKAEYILPLPSYSGIAFSGISNNDLLIGTMWQESILNRTPIVYTKNTGIMDLKIFLLELYGIDVSDYDLFTPMSISKDGKKITGWGFGSNAYYSYYIELGNKFINTRPLRLTAKQIKNSLNVQLNWMKPYNNGKEVLGYNVYKDSIKINTDLITDTTYIHQNIEVGSCEYAVTTVFADKEESKKSVNVKLQIVEIGGCYSVKRFENEIIYNKTILLDWGLPSAEIISKSNAYTSKTISNRQLPYNPMDQSANSPFYGFLHASDARLETMPTASMQRIPSNPNLAQTTSVATPAVYQNQNFDYISSIDLLGASKISLFKWNDYYYVGDYNTKYINRLDLKGNLVNTFEIENLPSATSFTTDGKDVYVACGNRFIYKVDLEKQELIDQIRVDSLTQRICYIPELDNNKGGFEVGGWFTSTFITMDG